MNEDGALAQFQTERRAARTTDDLDRASPVAVPQLQKIPGVLPGDMQVLEEFAAQKAPRLPLEIWREESDEKHQRPIYHVAPAYLETIPVTYLHRNLADITEGITLQPGMNLMVVAKVKFDVESAGFQTRTPNPDPEGSPTIEEHTLYYKKGSYTIQSAELHAVPQDDPDPPVNVRVPASSEDEDEMNDTDVRVFPLGFIGEDGTFGRTGGFGHFQVGGNFDILHGVL